MNFIYIYRVPYSKGEEKYLDISKKVAVDFFNIPEDKIDSKEPYGINICHANDPCHFEIIEIQNETSLHWSTKLNSFLSKNNDELTNNCLLLFEKLCRSFCIRTIKNDDAKYEVLNDLFEAEESHMILSANFGNRAIIKAKESSPLQQIHYGTPGSGKSHMVKDLVEIIYPDKNDREEYMFRTTFHPDSDYSTFVGCYKPKMEGDNIKYVFTPQAFTNAYIKAWQKPEKQIYLVIEEINRGNCAQIFGDLFQLLDRKDGVSEYPINADADLRQYLEKELGTDSEGIKNGKLKLPNNLYIWATMNTSDQSLFPMDSAFKRRWSWKCVPIDYNNTKSSAFSITIGENKYNWHQFLKSVNEKIVNATDSEDKQIGNFFINGNVDERLFIDKVMFYLWNDICKEEYHTKNNFFRYFTDEKKTETEEFTFNALFESNAQKLLKGFMNYLGVEGVKLEQSKQQMEELTQNTENITVEEEPITESDNE